MNAPLLPPALDAIRAHEAEMVAIRQQIHANPELAYEEHATSDLVAERLQRWGWEVHRGLGGTGVVGTLRAGTSTRRIGLRADMDALPIAETRQALGQQGLRQDARLRPRRPHRDAAVGRTPPGGHAQFDGDPARRLPARRGRPGRRAQDAGRRLPGAVPLRRDVRHAQRAGLPEGQFEAVPGYAMASGDTCIITVRGIGGHGAIPQRRSTRWWPAPAS
jgi:hippurate hydrolase